MPLKLEDKWDVLVFWKQFKLGKQDMKLGSLLTNLLKNTGFLLRVNLKKSIKWLIYFKKTHNWKKE